MVFPFCVSVCAVVEVGIRNWLAVSEDVCAHCVYVHVTACCVINYYENGTLSSRLELTTRLIN